MRSIFLLPALLTTTLLAGCGGGGGAVPPATGGNSLWQPSRAAGEWFSPYGQSASIQPRTVPGGGIGWMIPNYTGPLPCVAACPNLGYIVTAAGGPLEAISLTVTIDVQVTGNPVFQYQTEEANTGTAPASLRLLIQRAGDNMSGEGAYEYFRWWSIVGIELRPGKQTLTVLLDPRWWSSVKGKRGDTSEETLTAFVDALEDIGRIGATFGGGSFYGHGVNVSGGTAEVAVLDFHINR